MNETSELLCARISATHNSTCLLAFSCGKDAIAATIQAKRYFKTIIPFYLYPIPGLKFVEKSLAYYEQWIGTRIIRMPHPGMYRMLNNFVFQSPERVQSIIKAKLPNFTYQDVYRIIREDYKLPIDVPIVNGVRAADSPVRRICIQKYGAFRKGELNAVYDWNKAKVCEEIDRDGVRLAADYKVFGRSFDGIGYRFIAGIKREWPEDYQRILEWFPLAELELFRMQIREAHYGIPSTESV